jgi:hypothetical protein
MSKTKKQTKTRKPYQAPALTKLTPEARLKLVGEAAKGDLGAKELLELTSAKPSKPKKKSA